MYMQTGFYGLGDSDECFSSAKSKDDCAKCRDQCNKEHWFACSYCNALGICIFCPCKEKYSRCLEKVSSVPLPPPPSPPPGIKVPQDEKPGGGQGSKGDCLIKVGEQCVSTGTVIVVGFAMFALLLVLVAVKR